MNTFTIVLNSILAIGSLFFLGVGVWLLFGIYLHPKLISKKIREFKSHHGLGVIFIVSLMAVIGSLLYSDGVGFEPCSLCWIQRIFMYPIPIIAYIAYKPKDLKSLKYIKALAVFGILFATYHLILTHAPSADIPCPAGAVSCAIKYVNSFGFVTIPLMSFSAFLALLGISIATEKSSHIK